jgi:glycosyltransferase involved in cell wall biosynthesis
MRRVVIYASDSGLRVWGQAVHAIPGYEAALAEYPASSTRLYNPVPLSSIRWVRRLARDADAILAFSTLLGAAAAVTTRSIPVVAIDVGMVRLVELYGSHMRRPAAILTRPLAALLALTAAHAAALDAIPAGRGHARVVHQPAASPDYSWTPDRYTPYLLCAGSSGRDLRLLCDAARDVSIEVRLIEGGRELMPARGSRIPPSYPKNVIRYGQVSRETYLGLLRGATALVHPLPRSDYPVGITVLLEAMASGVPVVATDVSSVTEYQGSGTAAIVPVGDAAAMAEALRRVAGDELWARSLSEAARQHVERVASPAVVGAQLGAILQGLE